MLAAIVIIAINPAKQFAQARNTQRQSGIEAILNAVGQRMADNKGVFQGTFNIGGVFYTCPTIPTGVTTPIVNTGYTGSSTPSNAGDLSCLTPTYIAAFPTDPVAGVVSGDTGYQIVLDASGRVSICAPAAAQEAAVASSQMLCVKR